LIDPLKLGLYILLFLPGFIFVQTLEYHLLREKKSQFEKTLEILLWSAFIWMIAFALPIWWPFSHCRNECLQGIQVFIKNDLALKNISNLEQVLSSFVIFFLTVCSYSLLISTIWGFLRKTKRIDAVIKWATGRDWYPSVLVRFFEQNIDKAVEINVGENKYLGILNTAPDKQNDDYIILKQVLLVQGDDLVPLNLIDEMVIKIEDIEEIKSFDESILQELNDQKEVSNEQED